MAPSQVLSAEAEKRQPASHTRRGEVAELRWSDIDLDAGRLRVSRARVVVDHEVIEGAPKTGRSGERWAWTPGIETTHSSPYYPQTCGKVERFHQTLKKYLAKQDPATTKKLLPGQLNRFVDYYNADRTAVSDDALLSRPGVLGRRQARSVRASRRRAFGSVTTRWTPRAR
jgi:integrase